MYAEACNEDMNAEKSESRLARRGFGMEAKSDERKPLWVISIEWSNGDRWSNESMLKLGMAKVSSGTDVGGSLEYGL